MLFFAADQEKANMLVAGLEGHSVIIVLRTGSQYVTGGTWQQIKYLFETV